jgi:hypothetical protein
VCVCVCRERERERERERSIGRPRQTKKYKYTKHETRKHAPKHFFGGGVGRMRHGHACEVHMRMRMQLRACVDRRKSPKQTNKKI